MKRLTAFAIILALSLLTGCSIGTLKLYPGPELPDDRLATIDNHMGTIHVVALDDKDIMLGTWYQPGKGGSKESAEVLPGTHTFQSYTLLRKAPKVSLKVELKAGHEYYFDSGWFYYPEGAETIGEPYNVVKLHGCRIVDVPLGYSTSMMRRSPPVVECDMIKDILVLQQKLQDDACYIDELGVRAIFLPFIGESGQGDIAISEVVKLEFPSK